MLLIIYLYIPKSLPHQGADTGSIVKKYSLLSYKHFAVACKVVAHKNNGVAACGES